MYIGQPAARRLAFVLCLIFPAISLRADEPAKPIRPAEVSYYKQVRPIFQANCQGCHQPAKTAGGYVMTSFEKLVAPGESKLAAIVPKNPDESHLIAQITPDGGKAEMPKDKPPLTGSEIEIIRNWIAQGAVDDTPPAARERFDQDHPPIYSRPPVITAIDYSPDGKLLAIGGFHEVLLWKSDGTELVARLIGLSERIESVKFSPTGDRLAVTGGLPGRMGEVQVWDVERKKLVLSAPVAFDTVYGANWSPDGTKISFGSPDNSARAIDAKTGKQLLFMGSHTDWVLDTAFSVDGSHLVSVGRDQTAKLTEVATQRFVDNITSITPGALKGGLAAVARHPSRDEMVLGGADGVPKVYRLFRQTARVIGDDSNMIRQLPPMPGRVYSVAISADGKRIASGSSLDGSGEITINSYEFDTTLPDDLKAIMAKVADSRSAEEKAKIVKYQSDGVREIARVSLPKSAVYAVAFQPDGSVVAAAGSDGLIRLIDPRSGSVIKEFPPASVTGKRSETIVATENLLPRTEEAFEPESLPNGVSVAALEVAPTAITLDSPYAYSQIVVSGKLNSGEVVDVTRMVGIKVESGVVGVSKTGLVRPLKDGQGTIALSFGGQNLSLPVTVSKTKDLPHVDYVRDVTPVLSKLGCNAGTCHGSLNGKNGFKLSLRGYDPIFDVRALTDDHASRRVNLASPDDSLMLLKPTGSVQHVGGVVFVNGDPGYEMLRNWIADGAKLDLASQKVAKIEVFPINPIVQRIGMRQQLRVLATYPTGEVRDVTREAFLETGNAEVATANKSGLLTAIRRGEAPILVRYEGAYAATTLTVMGNRDGFAWEQPLVFNKVDEFTADKWKRMKIRPSELSNDTDFLRRVYLDLTGLPPSPDEIRSFLADARETKVKREAVVDTLIGSPDFVDYWTNKWADLLQVNRKFLEVEGAVAFRNWIREQVAKNVPYDQFVRTILTASGSNKANPAASYFKILRDPAATMENTTQLFLAVRFNCNKCHDHPFERWTQDQYYETSAYFAQVGLKADPAGGDRQIGGTAVESGKPLYEEVYDTNTGEIKHERTGKFQPPKFPYPAEHPVVEKETRRQELADWVTSPQNVYFSKSYVNRLWGYLLGVGIIEPIDDIRAGNPASNPELLEYLSQEFIKSGFNVRHVMRLITTSRTYQLSVETNKWNADDKVNYSHATARRLPAEVLLDSVYKVTGASSSFPGVAPGIRAAALPDSGVELPSGFLNTFGRPARESACECERSSGLQLGPVMALVSGPTLGDAIADPNNAISKLVTTEADDKKLVDELFYRILNRPATAAEIASCLDDIREIDADHVKLAEALGKREVEYAILRPKLERDRAAAIVTAQAALATYEKEYAPKRAEAERLKAEHVAKLEADLKAYDATLVAKRLEWEKTQSTAISWATLDGKAITDTNGATFAKEADGSVFVTGKDENGVVSFVAETDLTGITGLRLEVLGDPRLPSGGPGRAPDGNFVINEVRMLAAPKADPSKAQPVVLEKPQTDFAQGGFNIAQLIDGKLDANNGWAISPYPGTTHWTTFELKEPLNLPGGASLTVQIEHKYNKSYMPGRFRLSVAKLAKPIDLGLPEDYRAILATVPEIRTPAQNEVLMAYIRRGDEGYKQRVAALSSARAPLPEDPQLKSLQNQIAEANKPVASDPVLLQLRSDLEMSIKQATARRLTAAQDIGWALINSPAFLFNH